AVIQQKQQKQPDIVHVHDPAIGRTASYTTFDRAKTSFAFFIRPPTAERQFTFPLPYNEELMWYTHGQLKLKEDERKINAEELLKDDAISRTILGIAWDKVPMNWDNFPQPHGFKYSVRKPSLWFCGISRVLWALCPQPSG